MPIQALSYRGQVPYQVEKALDRLFEVVDQQAAEILALKRQLAAQPRILTLQEVSQGLSAHGAAPLNLTGLPGK